MSAENSLNFPWLSPTNEEPIIKLTRNKTIVNTCFIASENWGAINALKEAKDKNSINNKKYFWFNLSDAHNRKSKIVKMWNQLNGNCDVLVPNTETNEVGRKQIDKTKRDSFISYCFFRIKPITNKKRTDIPMTKNLGNSE